MSTMAWCVCTSKRSISCQPSARFTGKEQRSYSALARSPPTNVLYREHLTLCAHSSLGINTDTFLLTEVHTHSRFPSTERVMSFLCPGTPPRITHYQWSWLLLAMVAPGWSCFCCP